MPHVVIKMKAGRTEEMKRQLAEQIASDVVRILGSKEASVSVAIEDVPSDDWISRVYDAEIAPAWDGLYKKPGYGSRASQS